MWATMIRTVNHHLCPRPVGVDPQVSTNANFFVNDVAEVQAVLSALASATANIRAK